MYVAVYGTLKKGYGNNRLMDPRGFTLVGSFVSVDKFHMTSGGGFPIVYKDMKQHHVKVEIYRVDDKAYLSSVDSLEGHPTWYRREPVEFVPADMSGGDIVIAEMYIQDKPRSTPMYYNVRVNNNIAEWARSHD